MTDLRLSPSGPLVAIPTPPPPSEQAPTISLCSWSFTSQYTPPAPNQYQLTDDPYGKQPYVMPRAGKISIIRLMCDSDDGYQGTTFEAIWMVNGTAAFSISAPGVGDFWAFDALDFSAGDEISVWYQQTQEATHDGVIVANWTIVFA